MYLRDILLSDGIRWGLASVTEGGRKENCELKEDMGGSQQ